MSASAEPRFPPLGFFDDPSSLICGIGNVGRQDDGLGWAFIDRLEAHQPPPPRGPAPRLSAQPRRRRPDQRIRAGAVCGRDEGSAVSSFALTRPEPKLDFSFTSHAISVPSILATAQQCFGYVPEVYLLAIRGYEWELQTGLTEAAEQNLNDSVEFLTARRDVDIRKS